ncbi:MAG: hypothetical protein JKZ03_01085 [Flavobacteriaceae bacterium]|nr:hypothetical protein [Flavobacteriaceae bacterium]
MKLYYSIFILFFLSFTPTFAQENPFTFKWDNGFKLESQDKAFKLKFGGRVMVDHASFSQNDALDATFGPLETENGTEIRRGRFFISGLIYQNIEFKIDVDLTGGKTTLKDAYIGIKDIPVIGNLRIGSVKEPFGIEVLTSSKYISLMERALPISFTPVRNSGIILFNDFLNKRLSAQFGAFRNADANGNDIAANDGYSITTRVTGLAINNTEKKQLLHLGIGYSFRKKDTKEYKISSRPEAHLGPKYISTGTLRNVDDTQLFNIGAAFVSGSFSFQTEFINAKINTGNLSPVNGYSFSSYYGQVSYFLTGESKRYKSSYSGFDRIKPKKNFSGKNSGPGAWEVAFRYSTSDLNSKDVFGGEQDNITLGVNWYLNPATRIMLNHVWADIKGLGNAAILQARVQVDF